MSLLEKNKLVQNGFWIILLIFLFSPLLKDFIYGDKKIVKETIISMDTFISIELYDCTKSREYIETHLDSVVSIFYRIESYFDRDDKESPLAQLEKNSGKSYVEVPTEFADIVKLSLKYSDITNGLFDITIGPVVELWDIPNKLEIPSTEELNSILEYVNYKDVDIKGSRIMLKKSNMMLDAGGVAKGYAVDKAMNYLKYKNFENIIINAGGDLSVSIKRSEEAKVNVKHPRKDGVFWAYFYARNNGIATSGDYQRYIFWNGKRYHHILNPETGFPADNCISVTIIAPNTTIADIISTAVFIMEPEMGIEFINNMEDIEGVILLEDDGTIKSLLSEGLDNFKYKEIGNLNEKIS